MDANMNLNTSENQIIRSLAFMGGKGTLRHLQDVTIELSVSITILRSRKLITGDNYHYQLTDAGREYAIANGWLTAPANSEPQADVTPADIAAVEAMGEVAANVFGDDICDCGHHDAHPIEGLCQNCYTSGKETVHQILMDKSASEIHEDAQPEGAVCPKCNGAKKVVYIEAVIDCPKCDGTGFVDAQTAPVDGGSDERTATLMKGEIVRGVRYLRSGWFRYDANGGYVDAYITDFQSQGELIDAIIAERTERQQAEIRALESKLAAAAAALEAIANLQPYTASQVLNKAWAVGHNRGLGKAQEIAKETLADRLGWKV